MIHIYAGNGKGKTTTAFGLALRAAGQGFKVAIFQFLKPRSLLCGEQTSVKMIKGVKLVVFEQAHPMFAGGCSGRSPSKLKTAVKKDFERAKKAVLGGRYDLVVLDEVINIVDQGFVKEAGFLRMLKAVPEKTELVLTGRGDISRMEGYADYVTIMIEKKHPFRRTVAARRGIEY